jgi:hypothetical protein
VRRFTLLSFLCGCAFAASVDAAPVQVFDPVHASPKKATAVATPNAVPPRSISPARVATPARATPVAVNQQANNEFRFRDSSGQVVTAPVVDRFTNDRNSRIEYPLAKVDRRISMGLVRAASIAQERAHARSKSRCWRYVKTALLAAGVISSYPKTAYAKQAGDELVRDYGFKRLPIRDPYAAPIGAVLVYGSRRAAGHVEIRTRTGFVSDFVNKKPSKRPLIGVYAKA